MTKDQKDKICDRAATLAAEYTPNYWGCAQSSFAAVCDALREGGVELCTKEDQDQMFKGLVGLSGGFANLGVGTCGALAGTSFAVSLYSDIDRKKQEADKDYRRISFENVAETIAKKFQDDFNGLRCRDVTWSRWGKQYDSWNPKAKQEFAKDEIARGCIGKDKCTISLAARWAAGYILELMEDPLTLDKVKDKFGEVH